MNAMSAATPSYASVAALNVISPATTTFPDSSEAVSEVDATLIPAPLASAEPTTVTPIPPPASSAAETVKPRRRTSPSATFASILSARSSSRSPTSIHNMLLVAEASPRDAPIFSVDSSDSEGEVSDPRSPRPAGRTSVKEKLKPKSKSTTPLLPRNIFLDDDNGGSASGGVSSSADESTTRTLISGGHSRSGSEASTSRGYDDDEQIIVVTRGGSRELDLSFSPLPSPVPIPASPAPLEDSMTIPLAAPPAPVQESVEFPLMIATSESFIAALPPVTRMSFAEGIRMWDEIDAEFEDEDEDMDVVQPNWNLVADAEEGEDEQLQLTELAPPAPEHQSPPSSFPDTNSSEQGSYPLQTPQTFHMPFTLPPVLAALNEQFLSMRHPAVIDFQYPDFCAQTEEPKREPLAHVPSADSFDLGPMKLGMGSATTEGYYWPPAPRPYIPPFTHFGPIRDPKSYKPVSAEQKEMLRLDREKAKSIVIPFSMDKSRKAPVHVPAPAPAVSNPPPQPVHSSAIPIVAPDMSAQTTRKVPLAARRGRQAAVAPLSISTRPSPSFSQNAAAPVSNGLGLTLNSNPYAPPPPTAVPLPVPQNTAMPFAGSQDPSWPSSGPLTPRTNLNQADLLQAKLSRFYLRNADRRDETIGLHGPAPGPGYRPMLEGWFVAERVDEEDANVPAFGAEPAMPHYQVQQQYPQPQTHHVSYPPPYPQSHTNAQVQVQSFPSSTAAPPPPQPTSHPSAHMMHRRGSFHGPRNSLNLIRNGISGGAQLPAHPTIPIQGGAGLERKSAPALVNSGPAMAMGGRMTMTIPTRGRRISLAGVGVSRNQA